MRNFYFFAILIVGLGFLRFTCDLVPKNNVDRTRSKISNLELTFDQSRDLPNDQSFPSNELSHEQEREPAQFTSIILKMRSLPTNPPSSENKYFPICYQKKDGIDPVDEISTVRMFQEFRKDLIVKTLEKEILLSDVIKCLKNQRKGCAKKTIAHADFYISKLKQHFTSLRVFASIGYGQTGGDVDISRWSEIGPGNLPLFKISDDALNTTVNSINEFDSGVLTAFPIAIRLPQLVPGADVKYKPLTKKEILLATSRFNRDVDGIFSNLIVGNDRDVDLKFHGQSPRERVYRHFKAFEPEMKRFYRARVTRILAEAKFLAFYQGNPEVDEKNSYIELIQSLQKIQSLSSQFISSLPSENDQRLTELIRLILLTEPFNEFLSKKIQYCDLAKSSHYALISAQNYSQWIVTIGAMTVGVYALVAELPVLGGLMSSGMIALSSGYEYFVELDHEFVKTFRQTTGTSEELNNLKQRYLEWKNQTIFQILTGPVANGLVPLPSNLLAKAFSDNPQLVANPITKEILSAVLKKAVSEQELAAFQKAQKAMQSIDDTLFRGMIDSYHDYNFILQKSLTSD